MKKIMYCILTVAGIVANSHGDIYKQAFEQFEHNRLRREGLDPLANFDDIIIRLPEGYDDVMSKISAHLQQDELIKLLGRQGYDLSKTPVGIVKRDIDARIDQLHVQALQSYLNGERFDILAPAFEAERLNRIRDEFTMQQARVAQELQKFEKDNERIQSIAPFVRAH